ncbi:MAG: hypothetical protein ACT4NX_01770 [Deltaproteobacteria bacterium]
MAVARGIKVSALFLILTAAVWAGGGDGQVEIAQNPAPKESESSAVQFCQGKYNLPGAAGVEIITLRCPGAESVCGCAAENKGLREFVACGGKKKNAPDGANLVSCDSVIVGAGGK